MSPNIRRSVNRLLTYLWRDEENDWHASGLPDDHIFLDLERIAAWLDEERDD